MKTSNVNLDALIKRQDMAAGEKKPRQTTGNIRHTELEAGSNTYLVLRKPDFQRETSIWTPEKVRDLVLAYVKEDLVPAIILWRSPSNDLFVIDGAHRISSIIAWVNDDYGDKDLSRKFFGDIPPSQRAAADRTRELIEEAIGPYREISKALNNPVAPESYVRIAKALVNCTLVVQPLETEDVLVAERSFFKINEQGVPLGETEVTLLHSRKCPNAIAARAVNQRGTGHPHWSHFLEERRAETEKLAQELYGLCFDPPLDTPTMKAAILPICGKYSPATSLGLLLETINFANKVGDEIPKSRERAEQLVPIDIDGSRTVEFLRKSKQVITRMSNRVDTDYARSLDLHPLVYFYSDFGRHMPSSFLATVEFITQWVEKDRLKEFTKIRGAFEEFLVTYKDFFRQMVIKTRGGRKAVNMIKAFFALVADECQKGTDQEKIVQHLQAEKRFEFLKLPSVTEKPKAGEDFSPAIKSKRIIQERLGAGAIRCTICLARVPDQGLSVDHNQDKKYGGRGDEENAAFTHHYCNSAKDVLLPFLKQEKTETASA